MHIVAQKLVIRISILRNIETCGEPGFIFFMDVFSHLSWLLLVFWVLISTSEFGNRFYKARRKSLYLSFMKRLKTLIIFRHCNNPKIDCYVTFGFNYFQIHYLRIFYSMMWKDTLQIIYIMFLRYLISLFNQSNSFLQSLEDFLPSYKDTDK